MSCTVFVVQPDPPAVLRIGELSRRLGVSDHVLRAWERRYGLLRPVRSAGGFRLYSEADEARVRRMQELQAQGLSAAEAARAALTETQAAPTGAAADGRGGGADAGGGGADARGGLADGRNALDHALGNLDEPAAQAVLDRLLTTFTVETVLREVVLPYLRDLGERWQSGVISVGQEHFASNLIRGRLAALARGWGHGQGPRAVLACPPGELHDLPLLAFGIALNRNGWRIGYLGADTPIDDLLRTAADIGPDLVVLAATTPERFDGTARGLARLARVSRLALGGRGATAAFARRVGAQLLTEDPVTAAERVSRRG
jgi:MerR family transcriptional regulator, light-induced transcriptional regulator